MPFRDLFVNLQPETRHVRIMTTLAQRISETPMAPYVALLRGMTREQKQIVVTFITESMEEPAADDAKTAQQKAHVKTVS